MWAQSKMVVTSNLKNEIYLFGTFILGFSVPRTVIINFCYLSDLLCYDCLSRLTQGRSWTIKQKKWAFGGSMFEETWSSRLRMKKFMYFNKWKQRMLLDTLKSLMFHSQSTGPCLRHYLNWFRYNCYGSSTHYFSIASQDHQETNISIMKYKKWNSWSHKTYFFPSIPS